VYKVTTPNNDLNTELIPFEKEGSVCSFLDVDNLPNCNACGLSFGNTRPLPLSPARLLPYILLLCPALADTLTRRRPGPEHRRFN